MLMADSFKWGRGAKYWDRSRKVQERKHHGSLTGQRQNPLPQALLVTDHAIERRQRPGSAGLALQHPRAAARDRADVLLQPTPRDPQHDDREAVLQDAGGEVTPGHLKHEIGRASCRERV